jgi:hypothetical protein
MSSKAIFAVAIVLVMSAMPYRAESREQGGAISTSHEDAACRRDTRKLCRHVKAGAGDGAFLSCLQQQRAALSQACRAVLQSHGL